MTDHEQYYLVTILRRLREFKELIQDSIPLPSLGSEALNDEIEWLDNYIHANSKK